MKVIGLCGGSGSGKGAVCAAFDRLGIPAIDCDAVYHDLTSYLSPCLVELSQEFGDGIIKDGRLDRTALRDVVFDPAFVSVRQHRLNEITHKYVIAEVERLLAEYAADGKIGAIIDAPLLFEAGIDRRCDCVIAVVADRDIRLQRIMTRDGIDHGRASRRIDSQFPDAALASRADIVITNNGSLSDLDCEVTRAYHEIFG